MCGGWRGGGGGLGGAGGVWLRGEMWWGLKSELAWLAMIGTR